MIIFIIFLFGVSSSTFINDTFDNQYVGCIVENEVSDHDKHVFSNLTTGVCIDYCKRESYAFAACYGSECRCSRYLFSYVLFYKIDSCYTRAASLCPGKNTQICGSLEGRAASVYCTSPTSYDCLDFKTNAEDKHTRCVGECEKCDKVTDVCFESCRYSTYKGPYCLQSCPTMRYGSHCELICGACLNDSCNDITGWCSSGCKGNWKGEKCDVCVDGWYGTNCQLQCPDKCKNRNCNQLAGNCNTCIVNHWGSDCTQKCSTNCNTCAQLTGECSICKPDYWGKYCDIKCPSNCQSKCKKGDGSCRSCKNGYFGLTCNGSCSNCTTCAQIDGFCIGLCPTGWYGNKCTDKCPENCPYGCERKKGRCALEQADDLELCPTGWYGEKCSDKCDKACPYGCNKSNGTCSQQENSNNVNQSIVYIVALCIILIVLVLLGIMCIYLCIRMKRITKVPDQQDPEPVYENVSDNKKSINVQIEGPGKQMNGYELE